MMVCTPPAGTSTYALYFKHVTSTCIAICYRDRATALFTASRYQHLGSMMALGQLNAAVALPLELPTPLTDAVKASPLGPLLAAAGVSLGGPSSAAAAAEGAGGGVTLEGPLAALLRRGAYLYRQPTNEQRISVASSWLRMGLEAAASLTGGSRR